MSDLFEFVEGPDLDSPVLLVALEGWIDAGGGAARAAAAIVDGVETVTIARFDADQLLDHRARRPIMHLEDGMNMGLTWPGIELVALTDTAGNDVLMLRGAEPDHRWKAFSRAVVDLAMALGARMVVGLGAYPAPVPHTRPSSLATTATEPSLAAKIAAMRSTLDVPAGIGGAIEERCAEVGLPAVGLWAQVPHYAAAMPYPGAALVLVEYLNELAGLAFPTGTLAEEAAALRSRLDDLVANSAEHVELLAQLEAQADQSASAMMPGVPSEGARTPLPSGDELATEIERFLRDQGNR
jgi:predicted ATP-grasp superfamily ATP-dependent carboligase